MIPVAHAYILAGLLFGLGIFGFLRNRNAIMLLMAVELMLNAANVVFLAASREFAEADGALLALFLIVIAACEAAVGLALILALYRRKGSIDVETASELRG